MARPRKEWPEGLKKRAHEIKAKYGFGVHLISTMLGAEYGIHVTPGSVRRILEKPAD